MSEIKIEGETINKEQQKKEEKASNEIKERNDTVKTEEKLESNKDNEPNKDEIGENNDDIFVTEKDTFECSVSYYKKSDSIKVEGVDSDYDVNEKGIKKITFKCKYPSQADYQTILNMPIYKNLTEMTPIDLVLIELSRLSLLIRSWSVKKDLSSLTEVDPLIVKGMANAVREKLGTKGIF